MKLQNEIALVTGGGSGIGAAIATHFKEKGAEIALLDIASDKLYQQAEKIGAAPFICDITKGEDAILVMEEICKKVGIPRILVNAAGILGSGKILSKDGPMDLNYFSNVLSVNLIGAFNMLRLAAAKIASLNALDDNERGVIINIGSIAAEEGQIGQAAYSAAKAGLAGLTLPAARELARWGIRVVTIAPGLVETNMLHALSPEVKEALAQTIPFPQRLARPEEIAMLAAHIVKNSMLNGSVLRIDGALRMGAR